MGASHKIIMILGIVQNLTDMIGKLSETEEEKELYYRMLDNTEKAWKVWGRSLNTNALKKIKSLYDEFEKNHFSNSGIDWDEYVSLVILMLGDTLEYIKDKRRRQILINLQDGLGDFFDLIEANENDIDLPEKAASFFRNVDQRF